MGSYLESIFLGSKSKINNNNKYRSMKMKQWLLGAMTLGILTACSSEDMGTNGADTAGHTCGKRQL